MKGWLIKPDTQEVEEIKITDPKGDDFKPQLNALYKALKIDKGSKLVEQVRCNRLDKRWQTKPDVLLIDEEGRQRPDTQKLGQFTLWGFRFIGRGIIVSEKRTSNGATWTDPTLTLADIQRALNWIERKEPEPELEEDEDD